MFNNYRIKGDGFASKINYSPSLPQVAKSTDIRSKAVVLLLLIHCLNAASVSCGIFVFDPCFVMQYLVQLSRRGRESWLFNFNYVYAVVWL